MHRVVSEFLRYNEKQLIFGQKFTGDRIQQKLTKNLSQIINTPFPADLALFDLH